MNILSNLKTLFADNKQKPVPGEIASIGDGKDITRGYVNSFPWLVPQDKVLALTGFNYEDYRKLLTDDQVFAAFQQRRLAVLSKPWQVTPASDSPQDIKIAQFVEDNLKNIAFDNIIDKMLYGRFYGYSVGEVLWDINRGVHIANIAVRRQDRFVFDPDKNLLLRTSDNYSGVSLPQQKFWVFKTGTDNDDEPYGLGLAHYVYWVELFKRTGTRQWMVYLEKFGSPTTIGKYGKGSTATERKKLLQALYSIRNNSAIITPDTVDIDIIGGGSKGSRSASYPDFYDRMNKAISKIIIGQTMTIDDGSSMSQSTTHLTVREDIIIADAKMISSSFNETVLKWLVDYNFDTDTYPKLEYKLLKDEDQNKKAQRDQIVVNMTGRLLDKDYAQKTYNLKLSDKPAAAPTSSEFANQSPELDKLSSNLTQQLADQDTKTIDVVKKIVDTAVDLDDLQNKLITAFADIKDDEFTKLMTQALEIASLAGRNDVLDEIL